MRDHKFSRKRNVLKIIEHTFQEKKTVIEVPFKFCRCWDVRASGKINRFEGFLRAISYVSGSHMNPTTQRGLNLRELCLSTIYTIYEYIAMLHINKI